METKDVFRSFEQVDATKLKDLAEQALKLPLSSVVRLKDCVDMLFEKV